MEQGTEVNAPPVVGAAVATAAAAPVSAPVAWVRLAAPGSVRAVGMMAMLYGCVLGVGAAVVGVLALKQLAGTDKTGMIVTAVGLGLVGVLAMLLLLGGGMLARSRVRGRTMLLVFMWAVLPVVMGVAISSAVMTRPDRSGINRLLLCAVFGFHAWAGVCSILVAIVLGAMLMAKRAGTWADEVRRVKRGLVLAPPAVGKPRLAVLALLSLIFAFVPALQALGLIFGAVALGSIRRGQGALSGKWLAIIGMILSTFGLLVATAGLGGIMVYAVGENAGRGSGNSVMETRMRELDLTQRLYADLGLGKEGRGEYCKTSLTELLTATKGVGPIDDATGEKLMAADARTKGTGVKAFEGYYFKVARYTESSPYVGQKLPGWAIFAWPAKGTGTMMLLDPTGLVTRYRHKGVDPPDEITSEQVNEMFARDRMY